MRTLREAIERARGPLAVALLLAAGSGCSHPASSPPATDAGLLAFECALPSATLDNGDLGYPCAGDLDGGFAQGTCQSDEYCLAFLGREARCATSCSGQPCSGTAFCMTGIPLAAGFDALCVPECFPNRAPSTGCPAGDTCTPMTPDPAGPGYCNPQGCQTADDCSPADAGGPRTLSCVAGVCRCTVAEGLCPSSGLDLRFCDVASGVCYSACSARVPCDVGCCSVSGTGDDAPLYCQALTPANQRLVDAGSGPAVPGPHAPWPTVIDQGGPTLAEPRLVTLTSADDDLRGEIDAWANWVVTSSWLQAVGADYGIALGTNELVHLATMAPVTVDDGVGGLGPDGGLTELQSSLEAVIAAGLAPSPDANTLYMVHYPATTRLTFDDTVACVFYGGYHASYVRPGSDGGAHVVYAVIPRCGRGAPGLETVETAASHELIEAATDPLAQDRAWAIGDPTSPWAVLGGEVGDLCELGPLPYFDPTGLFAAQRIWSNTAAQGAGSPCVPAADPAYSFIGVSPLSGTNAPVVVSSGVTTPLAIEGWASEGVPPWAAFGVLYVSSGVDGGPQPELQIEPEVVAMSNGGTGTLDLTLFVAPGEDSSVALMLLAPVSSYGAHDTMYWPVLVLQP